MFQGFEWYLKPEDELWIKMAQQASHYRDVGFSAIWLPPAYKGAGGINDVGYGSKIYMIIIAHSLYFRD